MARVTSQLFVAALGQVGKKPVKRVPHAAEPITNWARLALMAGMLAMLVLTGSARAETHALILTIGNYPDPGAKLKGIDKDALMALEMLSRMGATQIVRLADRELQFKGLQQALEALKARVRPDDTVIIYFSGHGRRQAQTVAALCQESLVTADNLNYFDAAFEADLTALAAKASRVIVFNDSCHSAGASTKSFELTPALEDVQPKTYPAHLPEPSEESQEAAMKLASSAAQAACSRISNPVAKSFSSSLGPQAKLVYLAAAGVDEAAWATPQGSLATQAWHRCITQAAAVDDFNRDGYLDASELALCAQRWLEKNHPRWKQTITPQFNKAMPLVPVAPRRRG